VTFKPTAAGPLSATVSVADNASGSPQTAALSGTGVAAAPAVTLTPATLTFASTAVGSSAATQAIALKNTGTGALTLNGTGQGISITGANPTSFSQTNTCGTSVAAGATCSITVTFKPTAAGPLSATVSVADNASGSPQTASLAGTGTAPAVTLTPATLTFASTTVGSSAATQAIALKNTGTAALSLNGSGQGISITGANASSFSQTNTCGTSVAAGATCSITVTFKPAAAGALSASVSVADNASGSPQTAALSGTGVAAAPAVTLTPATLTFASTAVGSSAATQAIALKNTGTAALSLNGSGQGISITGANASSFSQTNTCGTSVAAGATCSITVTFKPTVAGPLSATVSVADNASGSPQTAALSGTGTAAAATPTFLPAAGTYTSVQMVSISDTTPNATIYFTTNGNPPTTSSTVYAGPITVGATETLMAMATATNYTNSQIASAAYTINLPTASTPVISPAGGTYTTPQTVTITDSTQGATIYYTTDGTTPSGMSHLYAGAMTVSSNETIKAICIANGYANSAVATATYTFQALAVTSTLPSGTTGTPYSGWINVSGGTPNYTWTVTGLSDNLAWYTSTNIANVAGNGSGGYSGDGGPATSAQIGNYGGVVVDSSGNFYFADQSSARVRKVTAAGIISTFAGTGTQGYNGDGILATSAKLNSPTGLAVDTAGNLYIADAGNGLIREVNVSTGMISTVAGTVSGGTDADGIPATSAQIQYPWGVAVDSSNNIYIADAGDDRIREVYAATGLIGTVAGGGSGSGSSGDGGPATAATLNNPYAVAVDGSGNIYISDLTGNSGSPGTTGYIREVYAATGKIATVAGNGVSGYNGDGASATSAELSNPISLAVDSAGNIFISDNGNNRIREVVAASGNIFTVAGTGTAGYNGNGIPAVTAQINGPQGVAVDKAGDVYFNDSGRVRFMQAPAVASDLVIGGTPSTAETVTFQATVTDSKANTAGPTSYSVVIAQGTTLPVSLPEPNPITLGGAVAGASYFGSIDAIGGVSPYAFTVNGASVPSNGTQITLGDGLSVSNNGNNILQVSGVPATTGTVSFTVSVSDSSGTSAGPTQYSIAVTAAASVSLPPAGPLQSATVGQPYSAYINAIGGDGANYAWTVNGTSVPTSGTPITVSDGITASNTGGYTLSIGGTPASTGTVTLNVSVVDVAPGTSAGPVAYTIAVGSGSSGSQLSGQIYSTGCSNNSSLPTMTVTLSGGGLSTPLTTQTDSNGNFTFQNVPNGSYTVTPSLSSTVANSVFYPASQTGVTVNNGNSPQVTFQVALGYTVTGTVAYGGSQTGRVYVQLNNNNCGSGLTPGTSLAAPGSFTIRGVPPGNYTVQAWMDTLGAGNANDNDPSGSISNVNIPIAVHSSVARPQVGASGPTPIALTQTLNISNPSAISLSSAPGIQGVSAFSGGVVIPYNPIQDDNGVEQATSYTVQWSTTSAFTTVAGTKTFKANGTNGASVWIVTGLANGQALYFRARGVAGSSNSNWATTSSAVTINAPTAGNTVTGKVTIPSTVTISGPLYVGFYNQATNAAYVAVYPTPSDSQSYTVQVPTGNGYFNFAILDQNNDGLVDTGDLSNTNSNNNSGVNITGPLSNQNIALSAAASTTTVTTQNFQQINQYGSGSNYNLEFTVNAGVKLPVAVTLSGATNPNVVVPMDIGQCNNNNCSGNGPYNFNVSVSGIPPNVGDTYTFQIAYSDGTTASPNPTAAVTGVLTTPPSNLEPTGTGSNNLTPNFSWSDTGLATSDVYSFQLMDVDYNTLWQIPGRHSSSNGFPSSITSLTWGIDPTGGASTPSVSHLTLGNEYYWQIQAQDTYGNQAVAQTWYYPGFTALALPAANPATLPAAVVDQPYTGTIQATGGYPCYSYNVQNFGGVSVSDGFQYGYGCSTALTINFTPTATGTITFQVTVSDSNSDSAGPVTYSVTVGNAAPVSLPSSIPSSLPSTALIGYSYSGAINASGGVSPYTWTVNGAQFSANNTAYAIPSGNGLTATSSGGNTLVIGGAATAGPIALHVSVTDGNNTSASAVYTVSTSSGPDGSHNASLKGQYACLTQGFNDSDGTRWASVASFVLNGSGAITSGEYDENGSDQSTSEKGTLSGTYSVGADYNGLLTVTSNPGNTTQWAFAVTQSASPAAQFRMIEIDNQGMTGSSNCYLTTPGDFNTANIAGYSFAFGMGGESNVSGGSGSSSSSSSSAAVAVATPTSKSGVGRFSAGAFGSTTGPISNGVVDTAKGGCTSAEEDSFSGTYTAPDSNGRFVMTLGSSATLVSPNCPSNSDSSVVARPRAMSGGGGSTPVLAIYIVDATRAFLIETDAGDSLFAGNVRKQQQTFSYTGANINGPFVLYMQGGEVDDGVSTPKSSVFQGTGNGTGGLTINASYQDKGGTYKTQNANGSISLNFDSSYPGRVTFQPGNGPAFLEMFNNNSAFEMDMDGNGGFESGWVEPQTQTTFTYSALAGNYMFGQMPVGHANQNANVGEISLDSKGNIAGTVSTAGEGGFAYDQSLSMTYAWDTTVPNTGAFLVTPPSGSSSGASCIVISSAPIKFACTQQTDTPSVMLMQQ
jgi:hypothetical protein